MIDWIFDLLAKLWDGFWNVIGKLIGSLFLAALICMIFTIVAKLTTGEFEVETAIFAGAFIAAVKLIVNEIVAPLFYQHGKLERERRKRLAEELFKGQRRF
jgi:hypothetical protein